VQLTEEATAEQLEQCRLTPELSRPTTREPGVELTPQQRTCLQLRRSGVGLNDLLGGAALGADRPADTTPQSPATRRNSTSPGGPAPYLGTPRRHVSGDGSRIIEPTSQSSRTGESDGLAEGDQPEPALGERESRFQPGCNLPKRRPQNSLSSAG